MSSHPRPIHEMEAKWQQYWQERGTYRAQTGSSAEPYYGLVEFPYPSGDGLHVGHPRSYTAIDIVTRKRRMEGRNVLYPMGWDAFGLPTENYAIKHKIKPADATKKNEANFRRQIQSIGFGFDWSREIDTTDPAYYKWTQWQFLQFVKSGMAYKAASVINWCPSCKIGLANEEAQGGVCERCGGPVEQRQKNQWMIRITDYADRLLQDLSSVDYLDKIASQQINWIGKSTGAEIAFRLAKFDTVLVSTNNASKVARVRKLLGATLPMVKVVTPRDLGIEARDVEEGKDMEENARRKARAYADVSGLPTIGMDTGFVIAGETLETSTPKRNALGGEDERALSQEEQAARMDAFYRDIARKHGGSVDAHWLDVAVLRMPDGTEDVAWNKREVILTDTRHGEMDAYFPVRGLYRVKANGKYVAEQSEDEAVYQELWPLALSLTKLCSDEVRVFTTRPDTLFGVTYVVLAPEHALVARLMQEGRVTNQEAVKAYIEKTRLSSDLERQSKTEKTGVALEGVTFAHPVTGEVLPVWIADYVLASYGTGAVMAVPAHDERDFAFAKTFGLLIKQVVAPIVVQTGEYAPREDAPTQSRMVVTAIVHRVDTDEYLVQRMSDGRVGFCGGGIDDGETDEQAIRREVAEETGYTDLERVERVGMVCGNGHKPKKSTNCLDPDVCFLVEVRGEPNGALSDEEQATHTNMWYSRDEVAAQLNLTHHEYLWKAYMQGATCETSMGIALRSGFLDGLPSWKAKEEMIAWLEEHGCGEAKSTYKLRDWVFSRQRYWGEPIPLVYCETCAQKKQKVLLIHGFEGSGEGNWFPWMKRELEARGFEVFAPTMSTAFHPDLEAWMQELMPFMDQLGEDDIIVGHSLGSKAALHLIERANKNIGSVFLVASAIGQVEQRDWERFAMEWQGSDIETLKRFWEVPYDWEKISALVERKHTITSDDDPYISAYMHKDIPAGWYKQTWHGFGHFNAKEIPELRDRVLTSQATGWVPLPDSALPLTLPDVEAYEPTDTGDSPLAGIESWVHTTCPKCGGAARRETDTMPNWAGSSWYFLRYCDPHNAEAFASREAMKYWLPVDLYNGGMEHTTLHLLYSRFWYKFLFDMGYVPEECGSEPYAKRRSHNMILAQDGTKMSKSKGNVVNPDDVIRDYGADVFRVYEMFIGPYDQVAMWNTQGMEGVRRFLDKVWSLMTTGTDVPEASLETLYHQTLKKIGEQIDALQFNTCISQLMILTNAFVEAGGVPARFRKGFVQVLAPFAPHLAEELWQEVLGETSSVHASGAGWPVHDASKIVAATFALVVQVNGKVRDKITVASDISEDEALKTALASEKVQKWMEGKNPASVKYVPGRILNIIT